MRDESETKGRLGIAGELDDVLPLEDGDALEAADLVSPDGIEFDPEKDEAIIAFTSANPHTVNDLLIQFWPQRGKLARR